MQVSGRLVEYSRDTPVLEGPGPTRPLRNRGLAESLAEGETAGGV